MKHLTKHLILFSLTSIMLKTYSQTRIDFEKYEPISTLKVRETKIQKAKFPFIDVHSHIWDMNKADLSLVVKDMDRMNMKVLVNLSGRSGTFLDSCVKNASSHFPNRFVIYANLDFRSVGTPSWTEKAVVQLETDYRAGARGLKIYENLGYSIKDINGDRLHVDDPRLDPIWKKCGQLGIPVLIHTGAPKSFWDSVDNKTKGFSNC